jgi:hypothetical protein
MENTIWVRYCMRTANDCGIFKHPQTWMKNNGFSWDYSEPVPIADCWIFRVKELTSKPEFLTVIDGTPFEQRVQIPSPGPPPTEYNDIDDILNARETIF